MSSPELIKVLTILIRENELKEVLAALSAVCYEQATEAREQYGPEKARSWVKAANYLMGTSINTNITEAGK